MSKHRFTSLAGASLVLLVLASACSAAHTPDRQRESSRWPSKAGATVLYNGTLIVGTDVGMFVRSNANGSWSVLGTGMPAVSTLDLSVVPGGSTLLAATHGRGIYSLPLG